MNNNLTPMQSFEQTIKDRLTDDIGRLIPDEALTPLIEKAIEGCFFHDRQETTGTGFQQTTVRKDSVFKEAIKELMAERMDKAIRNWLNDHRDEMTTKLTNFIETESQVVIQRALFGTVASHLDMLKENIKMEFMSALNQPNY